MTIQAYHGYLSFKDEPNITPELAQQIGTEFAKRVWGDRFQVVVTTHLNTKHLHCHFVVNSVSFVDGKRMQNNEKHWRYFRHIADELCRQHQLDVIENPKRGTGKNYYAKKLHEAGMPNYVDSAKAVIDEAISKSNSYADFKYILRQMGASFDDSPNHKYQVLRVLSCIIFSVFASSPPVVDTSAAAVTQVWAYIGELVFNMLVLVGSVKMSDRIIREMMGL